MLKLHRDVGMRQTPTLQKPKKPNDPYVFLTPSLIERKDFIDARKYKRLQRGLLNQEKEAKNRSEHLIWSQELLKKSGFKMASVDSTKGFFYLTAKEAGSLFLSGFTVEEDSTTPLQETTNGAIPFMFVCPDKCYCEKIVIKADNDFNFQDCEVTCKERETKGSCFKGIRDKRGEKIKLCDMHDEIYTKEVMNNIRSMAQHFYERHKDIDEIPIFQYSTFLDILDWLKVNYKYITRHKDDEEKEKRSRQVDYKTAAFELATKLVKN